MDDSPTTRKRPKVVVIGGGFGGVNVSRVLAKSDVDVTLIDRTNHHLFQPLLYQVATGILPEGLIAPALRRVVQKQQNTNVVLGEVVDLDLTARTVWAVAPDGARKALPYDTLVVAAGATHAYFGHDDWAEFAPGMKTLEDARHLRNHILGAFEMADSATDPAFAKAISPLSWWGPARPASRSSARLPSSHIACCPATTAGLTRVRRELCSSRPLRQSSVPSTSAFSGTPRALSSGWVSKSVCHHGHRDRRGRDHRQE